MRGKLCLAFPDTYTLGMSHHGLQVLYTHHEQRPAVGLRARLHALARLRGASCASTACRSTAWRRSRRCASSTCVGFSLQYEVCYTNILTMLDLGGIPLHSKDRTLDHPLVIAGGPGAQNPELLAPFVDLFVIGDGEESLPWLMERWMTPEGAAAASRASDMIAELVGSTTWAYAPMFYEPEYHADGTIAAMNRTRADVPREIMACTITQDFDAIPLPTRPIVSFVQTPHDRIAIEIMRGCPWQCRFCQSTVIKRPLRVRSVETIVQAALESYRNTGHDEISLLSLSTSDYPVLRGTGARGCTRCSRRWA